ncbi:helicase HerA domain-containing protein [Chloroflexota bacterium]
MNDRLGIITSGSLEKGLEVRLDGDVSVEAMAVGRYVTVMGKIKRFFGMITDVSLGMADQQLAISPPDISDPLIAEVLNGTGTFGVIHVAPMLVISGEDGGLTGPQPVKTVPSHYAVVNQSTQEDVETVFGTEDERRFYVGTPLDMETKICLDLPELVKRSNGVFGKSGTGKTFLTRILLVGMLQKSAAVNLIFDMHSEYGWAGTSEARKQVKGLKQLFPSKVAVFTLDEETSRRRGVSTDFTVQIGYDEIEPEDISLLRQTLNLSELAIEAVYQLRRHFGRGWLNETVNIKDEEELKNLLAQYSIHEATFQNLQRGLATIGRLPFIVPKAPENTVKRILSFLEAGKNVVLEFGRHDNLISYILVANLLSRRIYDSYRERTEAAMAEAGTPPMPLVITIEEAHKFLNPEVASNTIFGTIAREMRKYNVSLLVIDQRPSAIDSEVMSQMGTKLTCLLDNERDVDSVLAGVSGKSALKAVLSRLESKQQALIFGHAVPMPVVIRTRDYGSPESYREFTEGATKGKRDISGQEIEDLWA